MSFTKLCALALLTLSLGCATTLVPRVKGESKPTRVVLLPAVCSSVENACPEGIEEGVTGSVASELEFEGYSVIDARKLVAEARSRDESEGSVKLFGAEFLSAEGKQQSGSIFEDLSPDQRRALLERARANGIVSVRIVVGQREGISPQRDNFVQIRMGTGNNDETQWLTRCEGRSSFNPDVNEVIGAAALCALGGIVDSPQTQNVRLLAQ